MTIDWDKPIETTDGFPARVISKDYRDGAMTLVVVQAELKHGSYILRFSQEGIRMYHSTAIRNVKVKREGWINISQGLHRGLIFDTEASAKEARHSGVVATIKIEWEE
jgi:hypothetical protein